MKVGAAKDLSGMSDDDLLAEVVESVRMARSFGEWDRERLRSLSAEARRRGLLKRTAEVEP